MHSSRMRTARSISRPGRLHQAPPGAGTPPQNQVPPQTRHPQDQEPPQIRPPPPGPDPPQLPPWLWAWTRSPSICPLAVGLDQIPLNVPQAVGLDQIPLHFPLGCWPGDPLETCCKACWDTTCNACWNSTPWRLAARHAGIPPAMHAGIAPSRGQTHTCKHITLPQTSFAGGNNSERRPNIRDIEMNCTLKKCKMRLNGIGANNLFNVRISSRRIVGDSSKQDTLHCNRSKLILSEIQCRSRHHAIQKKSEDSKQWIVIIQKILIQNA